MAGSLRERRPGVWQYRIGNGVDPGTGKPRTPITKTIYAKTKGAAERQARDFQHEIDEGKHGGSHAKFDLLLDRWIEQQRPRLSPTTIRTYENYLKNHVRPALGKIRLDKLNASQINDLYKKLELTMSPTSVHQVHAIIHRALEHGFKEDYVTTNVADRASPPPKANYKMHPPTPTEVQKLIRAAEDSNPELAAYILLASVIGARRGEMCGLRWRDVNLEKGTLVIERAVREVPGGITVGDTKTHQTRPADLPPIAIVALTTHLQQELARAGKAGHVRNAYVFSRDLNSATPWTPSDVTSAFCRLREKQGLDGVRLHDLRHFVATQLLGENVPIHTVQEVLGHAMASTTLNIYGHAIPGDRQKAALVMGDLLEVKEGSG